MAVRETSVREHGVMWNSLGVRRWIPMPVQSTCPHCDSPDVERMLDREYEANSATTWYQCKTCRRMWSLAKGRPAPHERPDNDHSPDS